MHTTIYSEALYGIEGIPIIIEVNISEGLPKFDVVGLPDQVLPGTWCPSNMCPKCRNEGDG